MKFFMLSINNLGPTNRYEMGDIETLAARASEFREKKRKHAKSLKPKPEPHPACESCAHRKKKHQEPKESSKWDAYVRAWISAHPGSSHEECLREARKRYIPPNGKLKSYQRIWTEVWRLKNPGWSHMDPDDRRKKMREDFLEAI